MEHELFWSKLKPSVDGALVSDIIRSSSSGLNSHHTAAIELILERSIQERRERTFTKAKSHPRPGPTPQPENEARNTPTRRVRFSTPAPAPAPQPSLESLPDSTTGFFARVASSTKCEASQDSSALLKPAKKIKGVRRHKEPPVDVKPNSSPSEDFVELVCSGCSVKKPRGELLFGIYCGPCCWVGGKVKCVGCGTSRVGVVDACTGCLGQFK